MTSDLINHAYVVKPPKKIKKEGLESLWLGEHMEMKRGCYPGRRCGYPRLFPQPGPGHLLHPVVSEF